MRPIALARLFVPCTSWRRGWIVSSVMLCAVAGGARAIDAGYAKKLERSGCTQVTELQGCDLRKTRAENARAGFGTPLVAAAPAVAASAARTPYAGRYVARSSGGQPIAAIRIDARERVWVDGQRVTARRSDGALVLRRGQLMFVIQGDRRLHAEDAWRDTASGANGAIVAE